MKAGVVILAGVIVLATAACTQKVDPVSCVPKSDLSAMRALRPESAEDDAVRDLKNGDHRLLGVHSGVGLIVPGLDTNPDSSGYGLRVVEGADTPCSPEEGELNAKSLRYAKRFNQKMMMLWQPTSS